MDDTPESDGTLEDVIDAPSPDGIPEDVRRLFFDAVGYLTCSNTREEWGDELPEILRPGPEGSKCQTGLGLCECLVTDEPCLFGADETPDDEYRWTPDG